MRDFGANTFVPPRGMSHSQAAPLIGSCVGAEGWGGGSNAFAQWESGEQVQRALRSRTGALAKQSCWPRGGGGNGLRLASFARDVFPEVTQTIAADNVRMPATSDPASPTLMELNRGAVIDDHCYASINAGVVMEHVTFQYTSGWVDNCCTHQLLHLQLRQPDPPCPA